MLMTLVVAQNIKTYDERACLTVGDEQETLNMAEGHDDAQFVDGIRRSRNATVTALLNNQLIEVYQLHQVEFM